MTFKRLLSFEPFNYSLLALVTSGLITFGYFQYQDSKELKKTETYSHRLLINASQVRPIIRKIASHSTAPSSSDPKALADDGAETSSKQQEPLSEELDAPSTGPSVVSSGRNNNMLAASLPQNSDHATEADAQHKSAEEKKAQAETPPASAGGTLIKSSNEDEEKKKTIVTAPTASTSTAPTPKVQASVRGSIIPLIGLVTSTHPIKKFLIDELWAANTCTNASVMLFDLATMTVLSNNPLEAKTLESTTKFQFDPSLLKLDLTTPSRYMLKTTGCLQNYERIITTFYQDQDLTAGTTLLAKTVKAAISVAYDEISFEDFNTLTENFNRLTLLETNLETAYQSLDASSELRTNFTNIFGGAQPSVLLDSAPELSLVTIPTTLAEKTTTDFSLAASHWNPNYTIAYEWWIDNNLISTNATASFTPSANNKSTLPLKLFIGKKNTADNLIDKNFPFHEINSTLIVRDLFPVSTPLINLAGSVNNPSNTAVLDLEHSTGALSNLIYANCETFSSFAIKETNTIPALSEFTYTCNSGPSETFAYTLQDQSDGVHNLYFYAIDVNGAISTPGSVSITIDKTAPQLAFVNLATAYRANRSHTFSWSVNEQNSLNSLNYLVEYFDGVSWNSLAPVASANGILLNSQFSQAISVANTNVSNAKVRISFTDAAGNSSQLTTPEFLIQKPMMAISPSTFDFGSTLSLSTGTSQFFTIENSGLVATDACSSPILLGANAAEFSIVSDTCASSILSAGGQCIIEVAPTPLTKGAKGAFLSQSCGPDTINGTLNYASTNNPPTRPIDAFLSANEDAVSSLTLLQGSDVDFDSLTYSIGTPPVHGVLTNCLLATGDLVCDYTPHADYNGADAFTYTIHDGSDYSAQLAVVNISINPVNDAPVMLADQTIAALEDTAVAITLNGASDIDLPAQSISYKLAVAPLHGTLSDCIDTSTFKNDLTCNYTPALNYFGADSFTYIASDSVTNSISFATVTINTSTVNDAPNLVSPQSISVAEDTLHNFNLGAGSDIDGDTVSYSIVSTSASGVLTCTGGISSTCTYSPNANFNGSDSFTYKVNDGSQDSNIATVNITVTPVNDAPTIPATQSIATNEDTAVIFDLNTGSDIDGDALTYVKLTDPSAGTLICDGGTSKTCTYTPVLNDIGAYSFTYKVNDGFLNSNTATVTINISNTNDAPVMSGNQSLSTNEDTALNFTLTGAADIDVPTQTLSYKIMTPPTHGTISACITTGAYGSDLTCTYTPAANYNGADSFTYKAYDGITESNTAATVSFTVNPTNDAPVMTGNQSLATNEDSALSITLSGATDIDLPAQTLTYQVVSAPTNGTLSACIVSGSYSSDLTCTYTPNANFNGTDTFTYKSNDSVVDSSSNSTVTITVNALNDAPVMAGNQTGSTNEDTAINITLSGATDFDLPAQTITYRVVSAPLNGTLSACITTGAYSTDVTCTYTPNANFNGTDSFVYKANDSLIDSSSNSTYTITVNAVNDAPTVPATQSIATNEDTVLNFNLNAGSDIEANPLSYIKLTNPASGTLTCTGGASSACTYTPVANFTGTTTFTYKANDGLLDSNVATVTITVNAINDAPTIPTTQAVATNEDTVLNFNLNAGTDIEGSALSYIKLTSPASGTLTCTGGASSACTYTPAANFNGTTTFTYKVNDGSLDSNTATVTITVNPINDAPTIPATQALATNEDTTLNFNLNAGTDVDGNTLTYIKLTNPASGTLTCTGGISSACSYVPAANYNGSVTFTYKTNDATVDSNTATVTITVNAINDLPVVGANQAFAVNDNVAYNFTLNAGSDIDLPAQTLQYKVITAPTKGTLTNCIATGSYSTDRICTYTANANYNGTDSFTYLVNDTVADSSTVATVTFTVTDLTPPAAPAVLLASNSYTNSLSSAFTATSCTDTPFIFINEATQPTAGAVGWIACSTTAGALTYTMSAGAATKTVKLWSKDANGNVSIASSNFSIVYEITAPVLAITHPTYVKGSAVYTVNWTTTETNVTTSQNHTIEYFNGSAWATLGTVAASNGPLTAQAFTYNWSTPAANIATAKLRISMPDRAGNTSTITSNAFTIDSIAPTIAISSPANNTYYATTNATISGTCEGTLPILFSGDLQAGFTLNCNSGTFTQNVNFSNGDGAKNITLTITDLAGNQTSLTRNLFQDTTAPYLTKTTGANPQYTKNNTVTWGGTCEGNLTINFTGSSAGSFSCVSGAWSWTTPSKTVDGNYSYSLQQVDSAANTSTSLSLAWTRDNVAPALTVAQGTGATNNLSQMTFDGNCEGILPIVVSGTESNTFSCNNGTWSYTTASYATDATRAFTFTQTDLATNATIKSYSWIRNTQGPALYLSETTPLKTNTDTVTFSGTCQTGLTINITGASTGTTTCPAGTWSWAAPAMTTDAARTYNFAQTNAVPNTTSVSRIWYRKTNLPTVTAFTTTASNPSKNATIKTNITTQSNNANVFISDICTISDDSTLPTAAHICWEPVNGPLVAKSPAATMAISNYPHLLGWEVKAYSVYVWVKDEAGNISALTAAGAGTLNTDKINSFYDPGITPVMADVWAANTDITANPPTLAQTNVPAGSTVYIHWKATDNTALPAGSISLFYTQDEINFNPVAGASALNNQNYGCPAIVLGANEGCFKWTNGSPLSVSYKVQAVVNDQTDLSAKLISNPLNTGSIKILAGNTESGLGGSAQASMFYTRKNGAESDPGSLIMTNDGRIYFADYKRGILTVDPADGNQKVFIPMTGTSTGDGGPASDATLRYPTKIALDYQNRLLIMDTNRIRRVDLNLATPTIETIVGGGASTADTVVNPLDVSIYAHSTNSWASRSMAFFATPNGDIYFHSEYAIKDYNVATYRLRVYKGSTGQVISKYFDLSSGDWFAPATSLAGCRVANPGVQFDPANSNLTGLTLIPYHHPSYPTCIDGAGVDGRYSRSYYNPSTFAGTTNFDDSYRYYYYFHTTGMNGKTYITMARDYVNRVNFDGTYTRILGSGTRGQCADGTAATACNMDIQDFFITSQDKIYFVDGGLIRTVNDDGNVVTLFGQRSSYGNGVNALNARFDDIYNIGQTNAGKIIAGDSAGSFIKEFSIEGNINIIAGNGNYLSTMNTTTAATSQGIYGAAWFLTDPANGDLYLRNYHYRLAKLNRATGLYENITNCGTVDYWDLDAQPAAGRKCTTSYSYLLPIGIAGNKILTSNMKYNDVDLHYEDFMWKTYDKTDSYRQAHVAGTNDPLDTYTGGYTGLCASGSSSSTCKMTYYSYSGMVSWDATSSRWVFVRYVDNSGVTSREVWAVTPGGTTNKIAQLPRVTNAYTYVREGAAQTLYYCSAGRMYRHNMVTDTDLGALTWSMSNMNCKGGSVLWNSTRRSLIFPFEQNGLDGVAEYYAP